MACEETIGQVPLKNPTQQNFLDNFEQILNDRWIDEMDNFDEYITKQT